MKKKIGGLILIFIISFLGFYWAAASGDSLADSVLRLHVIANSDDPDDQALKLAVKDDIVTFMKKECVDVENANQAEDIARNKIPDMKTIAEKRIKSSGYQYPVEVYVGEYDFPTKSYGNLVLPDGRYDAVRVVIGRGEGKNWWCVLFPPLCLVSSSDKGLSLESPEEAQVTLKCLELLPKGMKLGKYEIR
ncbi:MAG: stage II sporulation protein R [Bacillota bacterium]|nr:stage II sporulation protein R [Bacillota bacterium]